MWSGTASPACTQGDSGQHRLAAVSTSVHSPGACWQRHLTQLLAVAEEGEHKAVQPCSFQGQRGEVHDPLLPAAYVGGCHVDTEEIEWNSHITSPATPAIAPECTHIIQWSSSWPLPASPLSDMQGRTEGHTGCSILHAVRGVACLPGLVRVRVQ